MSNTTTALRDGDVVRYKTLDRPDRWCREGTAIVRTDNRPPQYRQPSGLTIRDTYWGVGSDDHHLTAAELETAEVLFNLADVTSVKRAIEWERYAPADRFEFTRQHGLIRELFVRAGAEHDRQAELDQQRERVGEATYKRDSALSALQWERERYHQMLADPTVRPWAV